MPVLHVIGKHHISRYSRATFECRSEGQPRAKFTSLHGCCTIANVLYHRVKVACCLRNKRCVAMLGTALDTPEAESGLSLLCQHFLHPLRSSMVPSEKYKRGCGRRTCPSKCTVVCVSPVSLCLAWQHTIQIYITHYSLPLVCRRSSSWSACHMIVTLCSSTVQPGVLSPV